MQPDAATGVQRAAVALLLQPVAACLEYLEIVFARRIAQAHVHVRVTCAQTKGRGLGVGK